MEAILILTSFPEEKGALKLAKILIDQHAAACVHIGAQLTSIYHWKGKTETATEVPVVIKTLSVRYAEVEQTIKAMHPYELPEIIAVPIIKGLPAYLQWIADEAIP